MVGHELELRFFSLMTNSDEGRVFVHLFTTSLLPFAHSGERYSGFYVWVFVPACAFFSLGAVWIPGQLYV